MTRLTNEEKRLLEGKRINKALQIGSIRKELIRYCSKNRKDFIEV